MNICGTILRHLEIKHKKMQTKFCKVIAIPVVINVSEHREFQDKMGK